MKISSWILFFVFINLIATSSLWGDEAASSVIRQGENTMRGATSQSVMTMKIVRPEFKRELKLRSWSVGSAKAMVEILQPPKEEGVASLRSSQQMWNYLPKVDQVVRVPTSLMLQSWMGSDFTNDDLMKASSILRDYRHRLVRRDVVDNEKTILIECLPKRGAAVVWGKILYWARISDNLPVRQKFFDESGKLIRTLKFGKFKKMDDRVIPTMIGVVPADEPHSMTVVRYEKILYDRKVPNSLFTKEKLRQTSQEGKRLTAYWYKNPMPGVTRPNTRTRHLMVTMY